VRLFHPRTDSWEGSFRYDGPVLFGLTPIARATIQALAINAADMLEVRQTLMAEGVW
jgi:hypothetical protein